MTTQTLTLAQSVKRFAASHRRLVWALSFVRAGWAAAGCALALVYADLLFQFGDSVRLTLVLGTLGALVAIAAATRRAHVRAQSETRMVARLVEQGLPDLHNDLINAIEFQEALATGVRPEISSELMGREIALASAKATSIGRVDTLRPPSLRAEMRFLAGGMAALAACGFVFSDIFGAIVPRYLDPYGDHPPYSPTHLNVEPAGATIDYGSSLVVHTTVEGRRPDEIVLVLEDAAQNALGELPMLQSPDGAFIQTVENVREDLMYYARFDGGRSKRYPLTIGKTPRIGSVTITYTYPGYTRLPSQTRLSTGDLAIKAYAGTRIDLAVVSNRPLAGGPVFIGDKRFDFAIGASDHSVSTGFTVTESSTVSARVVDIEGFESRDEIKGTIEVIPDERPSISIVSPGRYAMAIPDATVPIVLEARDDLGVAAITLFRGHNGSANIPKGLFTSAGGEVQVRVTEVLDLADLGVRPGDVIGYYATATDTRPDSPQTAATDGFQISIISEEQFRQIMQQETTASDLKDKYDAIREQIESLTAEQQRILEQTQDLAQRLARGGLRSDSDTEQLRQLSQQQAEIGDQVRALMDRLRKQAQSPPVFDIEKEYKQSLQQMADRLERARELMGESGQKMDQAGEATAGPESARHMADAAQRQQQALEQLGRNLQQFNEQIAQANEALERAYKLMQDVETFKAIYQAQSALERQARSYMEVDSPTLDERVRMKELSEAQGELRDALLDMRDAFMEHAAEIEAELQEAADDARAIAEELDARRVAALMGQAQTEWSGGDGAQGHAKADEARSQLEDMIDFAQQASGSASQGAMRLRITMGLNPGDTMSQLGAGLRPGFTPGQMPGASGQGAGGMAGSNMAFDVFGSDMQGDTIDQPGAVASRRRHHSQSAPAASEPLAGSFEELPEYSDRSVTIEAQSGERFIEDYRGLIEAYFRRMAEEE